MISAGPGETCTSRGRPLFPEGRYRTMSAMQRVATHEFKNDYFYIVLRQTPEHGPQTY